MPRYSYQTVLRVKGIKPIRHPIHTVKRHGDLELLPVEGVYRHRKFDWNDVVPNHSITPAPTPFAEMLMMVELGEMA